MLKDFLGYTINLFEQKSSLYNIIFEIILSKRIIMLNNIFK